MAKKAKGIGYWTKFGKALISWQGIVILIGTGLIWGYFLHSFDLIPDVIPVLGFLDDVVVVGITALGLTKFYNRFVKRGK